MKLFRILFVALIIAAFAFPQDAEAQAFVIKDDVDILYTPYEEVPSSYHMKVETPDGNVLWKAIWYTDIENYYEEYLAMGLPLKGSVKIPIWHPFPDKDLVAMDLNAKLYPDGKLVCIIHINGSGVITPNPGNE